MEESEHTESKTEKAWWHWLMFGITAPFFRAHGSRELSKRETVGLLAISIVVLVLGALGILGLLNTW